MRIGIDARFFGPKQKGLGRYSQKLIENLEKIAQDDGNEYYIFLRKDNFDSFNSKNRNFKKVLAEYSWYGFKEQFIFPLLLNKYKLDLVHFCHFNVPIFYRKKFVVTIHDLILFHFPTIKNTTLGSFRYFLKMIVYHLVIRSAVRRARKIIAISDFTKNDIVKELKVAEEKIEVVKEGYAINSQKIPVSNFQTISKKYGIMKPYLLYVGNAYPHKNLERLCEAFSIINKELSSLNLVIIGGEDYFFDRLRGFIDKNKIKNVIFPGLVSDGELVIFYKEAELFVFPSLYEGFGLPPLEALSHSTAVASSDRTSMPEVLGNAAWYFNPEKIDSIALTVSGLLKLKNKDDLIEKGKQRLKKFSWEEMAEKILEVYRKSF